MQNEVSLNHFSGRNDRSDHFGETKAIQKQLKLSRSANLISQMLANLLTLWIYCLLLFSLTLPVKICQSPTRASELEILSGVEAATSN